LFKVFPTYVWGDPQTLSNVLTTVRIIANIIDNIIKSHLLYLSLIHIFYNFTLIIYIPKSES